MCFVHEHAAIAWQEIHSFCEPCATVVSGRDLSGLFPALVCQARAGVRGHVGLTSAAQPVASRIYAELLFTFTVSPVVADDGAGAQLAGRTRHRGR